MSRTTDVIVVGAGLAGLMAALAAAASGASVSVASEGMGNLSISPGCIDLLGYDIDGIQAADPFVAMKRLPPEHPYTIVGEEAIHASLDALTGALDARGLRLAAAKDESGASANTLMPTILGTLKPTWLVPAESGVAALRTAKSILVISVKGFRDCRPQLIVNQLKRYPAWADRTYDTLALPQPFPEKGRSLNALDLAHFADMPEGVAWLERHLRDVGKKSDLALMPPFLGARPDSPIRARIEDLLGCPAVEMLSIPPGVGGLRIRAALVDTLIERGVEFYENAQAIAADMKDGRCQAIRLKSTGRETWLPGKSFVLATGGVIGGGLLLDQGKAVDAVFGLNAPVPANVDEWTEPEIFGQHLITRLGIRTDQKLMVPELSNVYFAGRILGGYDWASEKSGHGVACCTGWQAGRLAAQQAGGENK